MTQSHTHRDKPLSGLMLRLFAVACLASMITLAKYVGDRDVHVIEMLFYRFMFGAVITGVWAISRTGLSSLKTKRLDLHFVRALVGSVSMGLTFWSVMLLPLAEAATIGFTVPMIATVLSVVFLSEYVGIRRWLAIIVGFAGIVIAIQPWHNVIPLFGAGVAFLGAVIAAFAMITVRQLSKTESSTTIVFYFTFLSVPVLAIAMFWFGKVHSLEIFGILLLIGILGTIGQLALSESLRFASIAVVMPMDYSNLIFATIYGYLIWDQWPAHSLWFGLPFIIGSGIYIALRERKLSLQRAKLLEDVLVKD